MRLSEAIEALLLATQANGRSSRTVEAYREKLLIEKASLSEWLEALEDLACIQAVQAAKAEE